MLRKLAGNLNRKGDIIKSLKLVLLLLILTLVTACMDNDRDETYVSRGEIDSWHATIQTTFANESGEEELHTEGGLEFKENYTPREVQYKITFPSGGLRGTIQEQKKIKIHSVQSSRTTFMQSGIEEFAEEMTLHVSWENEEGEVIEETIPLE